MHDNIVTPFSPIYATLNAHPLATSARHRDATVAHQHDGRGTEDASVDAAQVVTKVVTSKAARELTLQNRLDPTGRNDPKGTDMNRKQAAFVAQMNLPCPTFLPFICNGIDAELRERVAAA